MLGKWDFRDLFEWVQRGDKVEDGENFREVDDQPRADASNAGLKNDEQSSISTISIINGSNIFVGDADIFAGRRNGI